MAQCSLNRCQRFLVVFRYSELTSEGFTARICHPLYPGLLSLLRLVALDRVGQGCPLRSSATPPTPAVLCHGPGPSLCVAALEALMVTGLPTLAVS